MVRTRRLVFVTSVALVAAAHACGGKGCGSSFSGPASPGSAVTPATTTTRGGGICLASTLLAQLGAQHVIVGASMQDATAKSTPFDGRYQYIAGGLPDGSSGVCASCMTGCSVNGTTCSDHNPGCGWWGCWQDLTQPPGQFVTGFVGKAKSNAQIPMLTLYEALQASRVKEGKAECAEMNDAAFLGRYLDNWRFLLQQVGQATAFLHIEPDLLGYCEQANGDPHAAPAAVQAANPKDCASHENSIAGLDRCMIAMVRTYAPNAKVGLHASEWGTRSDVLLTKDPSFDVAGDAARLGKYLVAAGAAEGDFVVTDMSDRDAGWYESQGRKVWWDASNQTFPNFHRAFAWAKVVAETVGKPIVWWQVPVGNVHMPNAGTQWKDNRVDYLFAHMDEVAAAHGVAVFFGAGNDQQTTPETDGGNLVAKVKAYEAAGGQKACP